MTTDETQHDTPALETEEVAPPHVSLFESLRREGPSSGPYWSAHELAKILGYQDYRHFLTVIKKASLACKNSGQKLADHFAEGASFASLGSGARRKVADIRLSRYACYLTMLNADPAKESVARAQTYFAAQARKQENRDNLARIAHLSEDARRLYLRGSDVHERKRLKKNQQNLDYMSSTELAANLFRATQTEEKLRREQVQDKEDANRTHFEVGREIRETIKRLGGAMPESLSAPTESIQQLARQEQKHQAIRNPGKRSLFDRPARSAQRGSSCLGYTA